MMTLLSLTLFACTTVGLLALVLQRLAVWRHLRVVPRVASRRIGISILKPLCGLDDDLRENLERFAALEYPRFEVLLGVRDECDPAWPLAERMAARYPGRVRAVVQQGHAGHNPKVNQLVTLEREARYDVLLVSDSNTRPLPGYLTELAALFEDQRVGCVTNPVTGDGHQSFGSLLDNLHLASSIGAGQIGAKLVAGKDLVVGKSMAVRRSALQALGGFAAFQNHLAEDYVIGRAITAQLGLTVSLARTPIVNVSTRRTVRSFWQRYARWAVIHRTAVPLSASLGQAVINPWPLSLIACALLPSPLTAIACAAVLVAKIAIDVSTAHALGCRQLGVRTLLAVPVRDLLLLAAWARALLVRSVDWRGHRLLVDAGSVLRDAPVTSAAPLEARP